VHQSKEKNIRLNFDFYSKLEIIVESFRLLFQKFLRFQYKVLKMCLESLLYTSSEPGQVLVQQEG
jgi:hypothetical protein